MPLEAPKLDRRTFEQIYNQARLRIPRYTPEWTDFNDSDPGITLLQLFAWLTEMMLFEMNRVPERNYIKFLHLFNMELRPAQPAMAHLTFTAQPQAQLGPGVEAIVVRRNTQIAAQPPEGGEPVIFETEEGVSLIRPPLTAVQVFDGSAFTVVTEANQAEETTFRPLGWVPQVGSALYLGFGEPDQIISGRPFPQEIRFRVFLPLSAQLGESQSCREAEEPPAPPVELVWEYKPPQSPRWQRLNVYKDESSAFTREGYIVLEGPSEIEPTKEGKLQETLHYWLRCRLNSGAYPSGHEPTIDFIHPNTVPAINLATVREEILTNQKTGEPASDGSPDQIFTLGNRPIAPGSLKLQTEPAEEEEAEEEQIEEWIEVEDLLASGPRDRHYILSANKGEIRFGNGENGLIPPAGLQVVATEYRHGGGKRGNIGKGLINTPFTPLVGVDQVVNIRPAIGGRDEQDIEDLKKRAPHQLRSRNRAVTAEDFAALAEQVGGVAKATAIALAHPQHPGVEVPGAVTVVIAPDSDDMPPHPSPDQIETVCRYLNRFRLLTTEVYVKGPEFIDVKVEVKIEAKPYAALDAVAQDVKKAINTYLDPLGRRSDDPAATGWPFGAELYPTNLFGIISNVQDVVAVKHLALMIQGRPHDNLTKAVPVPRGGLIYGVDNHEIVVVPQRDL